MKKYKDIDFFEEKLKLDSDEGTPGQVPPGYSRSGDPKGAPSATTPGGPSPSGGPGVNPGDGASPSSGNPKGAPSATTPGGPTGGSGTEYVVHQEPNPAYADAQNVYENAQSQADRAREASAAATEIANNTPETVPVVQPDGTITEEPNPAYGPAQQAAADKEAEYDALQAEADRAKETLDATEPTINVAEEVSANNSEPQDRVNAAQAAVDEAENRVADAKRAADEADNTLANTPKTTMHQTGVDADGNPLYEKERNSA